MVVEKVFVFGAGLMGSGIAQVCAQAGMTVVLHDRSAAALESARRSLSWSVGKLVEKGRVEGDKDEIVGLISTTLEREPLVEAQLIIEAVFEDRELKRQVFELMDDMAAPDAVLASNSSAIPITELAAATGRPDKVLGLHFFSPVPMIPVVEVVRGMTTSDETIALGRSFVRAVGKEPILVRRDVPGFLINRINLPSSIEAMRLVESGVATVEDIDRGLKLATGRKMGIFETGDLVGLDVTFGALMALYEETREERWYPPLILRRKVSSGQLGRKSGRGWYEYDSQGRRVTGRREGR